MATVYGALIVGQPSVKRDLKPPKPALLFSHFPTGHTKVLGLIRLPKITQLWASEPGLTPRCVWCRSRIQRH